MHAAPCPPKQGSETPRMPSEEVLWWLIVFTPLAWFRPPAGTILFRISNTPPQRMVSPTGWHNTIPYLQHATTAHGFAHRLAQY